MQQRNLAHIASQAFNEPLLLEPAYARVFFSALGKEIGISRLNLPDEQLTTSDMDVITANFMTEGKRKPRFYQVKNGIAVLPVTGTLVHKLGAMRPLSGMTGYDGITARLEQAISDPEVKGVLLDIDSPGGQVAGAFDCADVIARLRDEKPIWALSNDMACSAAMLIAAACSYRLNTQTGRMGSIGVLMAHSNYSGALEQAGLEVTLIYAGSHKVDGNPYEKLPEDVRADFQAKIDAARDMFAQKVSEYTGMSFQSILETEAAVYDGENAVSIGFANRIVNSADAIDVMSSELKLKPITRGISMIDEAAAQATLQAATMQERQRISGIIAHPEAVGREDLAGSLALHSDMSAEQAAEVLKSVPAMVAPNTDVVASITGCDAAKGREALAGVLSKEPGMTLASAERIMSGVPQGSSDAFVQFMEKEGAQAAGGDNAGNQGDEIDQLASIIKQQG
ncbi:phage protein [Buttiauxella ferragutiae ATCC 51602]|uniref:Phage protein n=1 Tax=Buttiauxella ferragutiae ATCC 51602 TaxID=1354252 RepID=A0ABX2W799_9ENTR|nr:S49 family peptidase [Buttiauxella ferragutiae]OAT26717.1 phage protein [Buttiauxella ferragutiae ATCC 51602]